MKRNCYGNKKYYKCDYCNNCFKKEKCKIETYKKCKNFGIGINYNVHLCLKCPFNKECKKEIKKKLKINRLKLTREDYPVESFYNKENDVRKTDGIIHKTD